MLGRTYPREVCSISRALEVVGERWTLLILRDAATGVTRYEDFRTSLGVATNILSARLSLLCEEGLMEHAGGGGEYHLTEKGKAIGPALVALMKWGDRFYPTEHGAPRLTLHRDCGGEVEQLHRCEECGADVDFDGIEAPLIAAFAH
ncbi:MAG TPA: helix-turn-helix domain-containing protein [Solirubrobacterales bacterium]|nr:helix-turn-helix domain-containing protein [Solirubrobacterales bacterium]